IFQFQSPLEKNEFDEKFELLQTHLAIINGNHYTADSQILFLDPVKSDSIRRNIEKISKPVALVEVDGNSKVFPEVLEKFGHDVESLPRFTVEEPEKLAQ